MKIVITGSLGHISKPLAQQLLQAGHKVKVISSATERKADIEALGATAAIGSVEDVAFLTSTFTGADAVYCMVPPGGATDPNIDVLALIDTIAHNYAQAISEAGVKRVIHLSSIGAHTDQGNGILKFHYDVEQTLKELPADVSITHMRPTGFYYNLLAFIGGIKHSGVMASNYGGDDIIPWVSPLDIATAIAAEITAPFSGRRAIYVASEELSCNAVAATLGAAIGKPDLQWIVIPDEQMENIMLGFGMQPAFAKGLVEMNAAMHTGKLFEDYYRNRPTLSKTKLADYAPEFAALFNKN